LYVLYIPLDFCLFIVMALIYANFYMNSVNKASAEEAKLLRHNTEYAKKN